MKAIITVGVSGSGKTTWAHKQKGFVVVSRDDIRIDVFQDEPGKEFSWAAWSWKKEDLVTEIQESAFVEHSKAKRNIIVADTNLNKGRAENLKKRLEDLGYEVEFKFFHGKRSEENVDIETCIKRDANRKLSVGALVINKQWKQMNQSWGPNIIDRHFQNSNPHAVIFDIDGTLADHDGLRSPFEWHKVGVDRVRGHVAEMLCFYYAAGYNVIILSGRDGVCRQETEDWLADNNIPYHSLYMRPEGDQRKDVIIKKELFDAHVRDIWNVRVVVDDRKQVLQLWHDLGLNVINVGHINDYF